MGVCWLVCSRDTGRQRTPGHESSRETTAVLGIWVGLPQPTGPSTRPWGLDRRCLLAWLRPRSAILRRSLEKVCPFWTQFLTEFPGRQTCRAPRKHRLLLLSPEKPSPGASAHGSHRWPPSWLRPTPPPWWQLRFARGPSSPGRCCLRLGLGCLLLFRDDTDHNEGRPQVFPTQRKMLPESPSGQEVQSQVLPSTWPCRACPVLGVQPQGVWELVSGTVRLLLVSRGGGCASRASTRPVGW